MNSKFDFWGCYTDQHHQLFAQCPWISVRFLQRGVLESSAPLGSISPPPEGQGARSTAELQHQQQLLRDQVQRWTEGDLAVVFSQFGEVVDVRFQRHTKSQEFTGKCFIRYQDPRSCILATDNMNCYVPFAIADAARDPKKVRQRELALNMKAAPSAADPRSLGLGAGPETKKVKVEELQFQPAVGKVSELGPLHVDHAEPHEVPPLPEHSMSYGEWYAATYLPQRPVSTTVTPKPQS